ncbi:hypothetical protein [Glycomyces albidus]|uniref:Uncharacterized protein n=1 Tax=Glycomyces albidus TaxID=2656774 RepID=A0A6L5GA48_9ACTN|nr:hypothetical protein [Glycomyces albidus]MQM26535.1 hypothetical protein [Glycomyces albidus]
MSGSPTARLRLLGILFWLAGGAVITLGWMGMAELAYVDGQMPYLVSGGAAGLALVLIGSTLVVMAALFEAAERTAQRTADLLKQAADEAVEAAAAAERAAEPEPEDDRPDKQPEDGRPAKRPAAAEAD